MYCVKCGVKLEDTEKLCPLCGTRVYHPDVKRGEASPLYPARKYPVMLHPKIVQIVVTTIFLIGCLVTLLCNLETSGTITWSGYVIGAALMTYVIAVLPTWFRRPNPVIFVPCGGAALCLYLLYISIATEGRWFMSFAFPVVGILTLIVTTVVTLCRYLGNGRLYIFGGAFMAAGLSTILVEFLLNITFNRPYAGWFIYPMVPSVLIGGMLIYLAICRPARETMERKFFV